VRAAISEAAERCGIRVLTVGVLADHVHLLVSFRPSTRLSEFVGYAKGLSAYRANRHVVGGVRWSRGYYAGSVSKGDLDLVRSYVMRQHQRHPDLVPRRRANAT
jgi:putative transposase